MANTNGTAFSMADERARILKEIGLVFPKIKLLPEPFETLMRYDYDLTRRQNVLVVSIVNINDLFDSIRLMGTGMVSGFIYAESQVTILNALLAIAGPPGILLLTLGDLKCVTDGSVDAAVQQATQKYCIKCKHIHCAQEKLTHGLPKIMNSAIPLIYKLAGASSVMVKGSHVSLQEVGDVIGNALEDQHTILVKVPFVYPTEFENDNANLRPMSKIVEWTNTLLKEVESHATDLYTRGDTDVVLSILSLNIPRTIVSHVIDPFIYELRTRFNLNISRVIWSFDVCLSPSVISVTLLPINKQNRLKLIDAPVSTCGSAFSGIVSLAPTPLMYQPSPNVLRASDLGDSYPLLAEAMSDPCVADYGLTLSALSNVVDKHGSKIGGVLAQLCNVIKDNENEMTRLDLICGDGDCGISLRILANCVLHALENNQIPLVQMPNGMAAPQLYLALGALLVKSSESSFGTIFGTLLLKFGSNLIGSIKANNLNTDLTLTQIAKCIEDAVRECSQYKGAKIGMRTLFDALLPATRAFRQAISDGSDLDASLGEAETAATAGTEATKDMIPSVGRSTFIPFKQLEGSPDPGAWTVTLLITTIRKLLV